MQKWPHLENQRKALRLAGFDYANPDLVFFVTICARHLGQPFSAAALARGVVDSLLFLSQNRQWRLYAYCLMPNHLHLALSPEPGTGGLVSLLQRFKSHTTRLAWQFGQPGALWQRSYYDHVARKEEGVVAICQYILDNPVRKGLVADAGLWPYSGSTHTLPG